MRTDCLGKTFVINTAEYTSFAVVRLVGGRGSCLAQFRDVHHEATGWRLQCGAAQGLDVRRACYRVMFEPEPLRRIEQFTSKLRRVCRSRFRLFLERVQHDSLNVF